MRKEIYNAAVRGDIEFLTNARAKDVEAVAAAYSDDEFLGLTTHGNNIIHVAAKHGHLDFINSALQTFPESATRLVCGTNNDGDTPLHVAAKLTTSIVAEHLIAAIPSPSSAIWRAQNNNGNTPLHMALINGGKSLQVAAYLIQVGPQVASYANLRKEAPLHLAVQYCNEGARVSMTNMMNKINGLGASLDYRKSLYEDDSLPLIKLLLQASTGVCCLQDKDGFTPLLRATLNSNLSVVEVIINYCPECVEICDTKGRTILHHVKFPSFLETRKFLGIPEISALIDQQDEDGNTALHIATMNYDYSKVNAMIECNANFMIRNHKGTSAASLIQSEPSSFLNNVKYNMKSEIVDYGELMAKELYKAAGNGEWQYLRERLQDSESEKQFLGRLPDGSNIIHVAVEDCPIDRDADLIYCSNNDDEDGLLQESFIVDALTKFPILSCQTNSKGLTPLHIAMRHRLFKPGGAPFKFLQLHLRHIYDLRSRFQLPPWKVQDEDGDTLLHMALKYSRYKFAEYLIELDEKCVGQINHYNKTPLHYLCKGYGSGNGKSNHSLFITLHIYK
ncbi:Protein ACCELERATED CELL DEATH 6 [Bienertia sinuspersici]